MNLGWLGLCFFCLMPDYTTGPARPSLISRHMDRYEGRIVQQMIVKDGGKGTFKEVTPGMLGIWGALVKVRLCDSSVQVCNR